MGILWREGTWDGAIWRDVFDHNEYGLPESFSPDDVIIDVGAHIGSFTYSCLHRGAGHVVAIEPDPRNAGMFRHNLFTVCRAADRVTFYEGAACRFGGASLRMPTPGENTGGTSVLGTVGESVASYPLDDVVSAAMEKTGCQEIRLVKLDCEGSEWPILLTFHGWWYVREWVGEYHGISDLGGCPAARVGDATSYGPPDLIRVFDANGYHVSVTPTAGGLGKFRAIRR